jgi:hypothetical protein
LFDGHPSSTVGCFHPRFFWTCPNASKAGVFSKNCTQNFSLIQEKQQQPASCSRAAERKKAAKTPAPNQMVIFQRIMSTEEGCKFVAGGYIMFSGHERSVQKRKLLDFIIASSVTSPEACGPFRRNLGKQNRSKGQIVGCSEN